MSDENRIKNLKFHVNQNDYFGTLATILNLFRQDTLEKKFIYDKEDVLENIIKDLMFFQDNYKIIRKCKKKK